VSELPVKSHMVLSNLKKTMNAEQQHSLQQLNQLLFATRTRCIN
jgi:hypothetical protein